MAIATAYAQAVYDYQAKYPDEITFRSGDIFQVLYQIDHDWVYAKSLMSKSGEKMGMAPANHLHPVFLSDDVGGQAFYVAVEDYKRLDMGDIELKKGDIVIGLKPLDQIWLYGCLMKDSAMRGKFPLTFVRQVYLNAPEQFTETAVVQHQQQQPPSSQKHPTNIPVKMLKQAKCTFDFYNQPLFHVIQPGVYLNLREGDYLLVKGSINSEWYAGENLSGENGIFPAANVKILTEGDENDPKQSFYKSFTTSSLSSLTTMDESEPPSILSRTQRRYTLINHEEEKQEQQPSTSQQKDPETTYYNTLPIEEEVVNLDATYCLADYDFVAKHPSELNCFKGDYFELVTKRIKALDQWLEVKNQHGYSGLVPKNYVTMIAANDVYANLLASKYFDKHHQRPVLSSVDSIFHEAVPKQESYVNLIESPFATEIADAKQRSQSQSSNDSVQSVESSAKHPFSIKVRPPPKPPVALREKPRPPPKPPAPKSRISNTRPESKKIEELSIRFPTLSILSEIKDETATPERGEMKKELKKHRRRIIDELIETERIYCRQLDACYKVFMDDSHCPMGLDKVLLFSDLKYVIEISQHLSASLDSELILNDMDSIRIGSCLSEYVEVMKLVYCKYLSTFNFKEQHLKKFENSQDTRDYILARLEAISDHVKNLSLVSILGLPVQRIFRYPLFINRLLKETESDHVDFEPLKKAAFVFSELLEKINERKRGIELTEKYLSKHNESLAEMMKKINMRTLRKKMIRTGIQVESALGIYNPQIIDENFQAVNLEFRRVEKSIKDFKVDLTKQLIIFKDFLQNEYKVFVQFFYLYENEFSMWSKLEYAANQRCVAEFEKFVKMVQRTLHTLKNLLGLFEGPKKLIEKRGHKLMDYEAARSAIDQPSLNLANKEAEKRLEETKKLYYAMNDQLLEELPPFTANASKVLCLSVEEFLLYKLDYVTLANSNFKESLKKLEKSSKEAVDTSNYLSRFSKLSDSVASSAESTGRSQFYSYHLNEHSVIVVRQTEGDRELLTQKYLPTKMLYQVTAKFDGDDAKVQLSVEVDDLVGVIKQCDPSGNTEMWLVTQGTKQGFVPANVLSLFAEKPCTTVAIFSGETNKPLIDFGDESLTDKTNNAPATKYSDELFQIFTPTVQADAEKGEFCMALKDFKAMSANSISVTQGDILKVLAKVDAKGDAHWWLVEKTLKDTNQTVKGYIPISCVQIL